MTEVLAVTGICVSVAALIVSLRGEIVARRHVQLVERQRRRDFGATVVAEQLGFERTTSECTYTLRVTNAGPATARDVDVALVEWTDEDPIGRTLAEVEVAPALLRGDHRTVRLALPVEDARFDDRGVAIELSSAYYDDNGGRSERLALVVDGALIQLPPESTEDLSRLRRQA